MGVYWIHPDVCPSISGTFWKITIGSIHFIPGIYPYGVSQLTPIHFRVPTLIFGPLVAKYLAENGVSGTFWKNYWLNSFHTWHLSLWGESLDPYTFSCSYPHFRPSGGQIFGRKWGFLNFFKKNIGSIHFIPGIYPYWVSLLTSIHFHVPSLIFGPLVAKYLAENGVSGTFWKKKTIGSIHFIPGIYPYGVNLLTPIHFRVPILIFGPLVAKYLAENGVSWTFSKKILAQFISYLAFILIGWVSWPLYIFMFLASFSALWWPNIWLKMGFPVLFEKKKLLDEFISYLAFILMGWVSWPLYIFVFLASLSAIWWPNIWLKMGFPNIWPKMGFPELSEKTISSINFIPGIYPYGVSFLTPVHFRVPSFIFVPLMATFLAENGVSGTFWKN